MSIERVKEGTTESSTPIGKSPESTSDDLKIRRGRSGAGAFSIDSARSLGLCATCIIVETCRFRRDYSQPVLECDEFDMGRANEGIGNGADTVVEGKNGKSQFKGLCANCDIRHECNIAKPIEGVWHCVEYR